MAQPDVYASGSHRTFCKVAIHPCIFMFPYLAELLQKMQWPCSCHSTYCDCHFHANSIWQFVIFNSIRLQSTGLCFSIHPFQRLQDWQQGWRLEAALTHLLACRSARFCEASETGESQGQLADSVQTSIVPVTERLLQVHAACPPCMLHVSTLSVSWMSDPLVIGSAKVSSFQYLEPLSDPEHLRIKACRVCHYLQSQRPEC